MKVYSSTIVCAALLFTSICVQANDIPVNNSANTQISPTLSKAETQQGIENGSLCSDAKGLGYSRGAVINQNGKFYRCVKVYGENFIEHKKLAWVELVIKNGEAVTAD